MPGRAAPRNPFVKLFAIRCITCKARLKVRDTAAIGQILPCPRCGSMVQVTPPEGWQPPAEEGPAPKVAPLPGMESPPEGAAEPAGAQATALEAAVPWASTTQRLVQRWVLAAGVGTAAVVLAVGGYFLLRSNAAPTEVAQQTAPADVASELPTPEDPPAAEEQPETPAEAPQQSVPETPAAEAPQPPRDALPRVAENLSPPEALRRWLPKRASAGISVRLDALRTAPGAETLLAPQGWLWQQSVGPLLETFDLPPESLRRVTGVVVEEGPSPQAAENQDPAEPASDPVLPAGRRVLWVLQFDRPLDAAALAARGEQLTLAGDLPALQGPVEQWPDPLVLADPQTVVTGPAAWLDGSSPAVQGLLGPEPQALVQRVEEDWHFAVVGQGPFLHAALTRVSDEALGTWAALRPQWEAAAESSDHLVLALHFGAVSRAELVAACATQDAALRVQRAVEEVLRGADGALAAHLAWLESQRSGGRLGAADLQQQGQVTHELQAALSGRDIQREVARVRVQMRFGHDLLDPLVWLVLAQPKAPDAAVAANDPDGEPPEVAEEVPAIDLEARLADRVESLHLRGMALVDFADFVRDLTTIPVTLDIDALAEVGITADSKIDLRLSRASASEILDAAVAQIGAAYLVESAGVRITSPSRQQARRRTARYDVRDLAADEGATAALAELVRAVIEPESWDPAGPGRMEPQNGTLVVEQTDAVHYQVLSLCERLRAAHGKPLRSRHDPAQFALTPRFARAAEPLAVPVTVNYFRETPLRQIVDFLQQRTSVNLVLDIQALVEIGLSLETRTTLTADRQPLAEVLDELCEPLGMAWRVVDDHTVQLTSAEAAQRRLEVELYPVAPLLADRRTGEALVERLTLHVAPLSWKEAGGSGVVRYDAGSRTLIVAQSQSVQRRIAQWLAEQQQEQQPAAAAGEE